MSYKLKELLKCNEFVVTTYDYIQQFYFRNCITNNKFIEKRFEKKLGYKPNLKNPTTYNEKLQWLKLNWYDPIAVQCADKYEVRKFVRQRVGEEILNEFYNVYESVDEIDIDELPDKFVLKGTHGSGFNIICTDKSKMNWEAEFKKMKRWLRINYYYQNREWVYKDIKPRIICEAYLEQEEGNELRDYRFFCFNGEPKFIAVDFSIIDKSKTRRNLYDLQWNLIDAEISYPKEMNIKVDKPQKLDEMIQLSKKLSAGFPHARIDYYYINNRIYFGEITFFHQSGMGRILPKEFELKMGSWLELPTNDTSKT